MACGMLWRTIMPVDFGHGLTAQNKLKTLQCALKISWLAAVFLKAMQCVLIFFHASIHCVCLRYCDGQVCLPGFSWAYVGIIAVHRWMFGMFAHVHVCLWSHLGFMHSEKGNHGCCVWVCGIACHSMVKRPCCKNNGCQPCRCKNQHPEENQKKLLELQIQYAWYMAFVLYKCVFSLRNCKHEIIFQGSVMDNAEQIGIAVKYVGLRPSLPVMLQAVESFFHLSLPRKHEVCSDVSASNWLWSCEVVLGKKWNPSITIIHVFFLAKVCAPSCMPKPCADLFLHFLGLQSHLVVNVTSIMHAWFLDWDHYMLACILRRGHHPKDKRVQLIYEMAEMSLPGAICVFFILLLSSIGCLHRSSF